jgi:hypothetical protein
MAISETVLILAGGTAVLSILLGIRFRLCHLPAKEDDVLDAAASA